MKNERKNVVAGCIWSILNSEFTWLWTDSLHTGSYCPPIKKKSSNYASLPLYVHFSAHAHTHTHTHTLKVLTMSQLILTFWIKTLYLWSFRSTEKHMPF